MQIRCQTHVNGGIQKEGNKQIALRVEPELEAGIQKALSMDGDASISAWIKRIIRKELKQKGIEV